MRKRGFLESTPSKLVLLIVTFIFLMMLTTQIFSEINFSKAICKFAPFLCSERQDVDYEVSLKSAQNAICAVGSAWEEKKWDGGLDCNWGEPETGEPFAEGGGAGGGGSRGTAGITAFAASEEEEELEISDARKLPSTVDCGKNDIGEYTCTVYNFIMPQEIEDAERYIAFWGDPHYLIYWSTFPQEEDTWNFDIEWGHHAAIVLLAIIPPGKGIGFSLKTFSTAFKGAGKGFLAKDATKTLIKNAERGVIRTGLYNSRNYYLAKRAARVISKEEIDFVLANVGRETIEDAAAKKITKTFSKMTRSELKNMFKSAGDSLGAADTLVGREWGKRIAGRIKALAITVRDGLKDVLNKRIRKFTNKPVQEVIFGGLKIATAEAALHALAESTMGKYVPVGNAIAIKNPGNESEDLKPFPLPKGMEGKPVMIKWEPEGGGEMKHMHFASPCYIKEFEVTKVEEFKCGEYTYDKAHKETTCGGESKIEKAPLKCGEFNEENINPRTMPGMYGKINNRLKMESKNLFEFDDVNSKNLTKLYLPWFLSEDGDSPKYYIKDIEFNSPEYKASIETTTSKGDTRHTQVTGTARDLIIDNSIDHNLRNAAGYYETYDGGFSCDNCVTFDVAKELSDFVIFKDREYILHIYYVRDSTPLKKDPHDVAVDIYDISECIEMMIFDEEYYKGEHYKKPISCEEIVSQSYDEIFGTANSIKSQVRYVKDNSGELFVKFKAEDNMRVEDLNELEGIDNCGDSAKSHNCFRMLTDRIPVEIECNENTHMRLNVHPLRDGIFHEFCKFEIPPIINEITKTEIKYTRHASYNVSTGTIYDVSYSELSFEIKKELTEDNEDIIVTFDDSDEDDHSLWDTISFSKKLSFFDKINPFGKEKRGQAFTVTLSDIGEGGKFNYISMENCNIDGVVISFKDDSLKDSKIDVNGPNYCIRELSAAGQTLQTIGRIVGGTMMVAGFIVGGGWGLALGVVGGVAEVGGELQADYKLTWPRSAGG